jgi:hypothetical protein
LRRAAVVSLLVKRWGEPKQCLRWRGRAAPLEPRRKRRGSDQPLRRAAVVSLLVKRWGERKQCPRWRCRAAPLEPRRKRRGATNPKNLRHEIHCCVSSAGGSVPHRWSPGASAGGATNP